MKYRIFILGLIAILFAACAVSEVDHSAPLLDDGEEFYATIEGATTKAYVDEDLRVLWHADDRVSIFYEYTFNRQYRFTGETGDNSGTFEKVPQDDFITGNALDYVYAVYPYKEGTKISNRGVLTLDLPATQTYVENSFGIGANTMVSCSEGNELLFKNLCGYIMLKLYGDDVTVSSISLKGNNNESLAGKATVTATVDGNPSLSFDSSATDEITLTFDTPVTLGTTAATATTFWLVVPPTTFGSGITLTVTTNDGAVFEKRTTGSLTISRNTRSSMAALEVWFDRVATTIAEVTAQITSSDRNNPSAYSANLTGAVVSYVNRSNAYIEDESGAILLYLSNHGLEPGKKISGPIKGTGYLYNGLPEITAIGTEATIADGGTIPQTEMTVADLLANYAPNFSRRIILKGVTVKDGIADGDRNGVVTQNGTDINVYAGLNNKGLVLTAGATGDFICFPNIYINSQGVETKQLSFWDNAHFTASGAPAAATIKDFAEEYVKILDIWQNTTGTIDMLQGEDFEGGSWNVQDAHYVPLATTITVGDKEYSTADMWETAIRSYLLIRGYDGLDTENQGAGSIAALDGGAVAMSETAVPETHAYYWGRWPHNETDFNGGHLTMTVGDEAVPCQVQMDILDDFAMRELNYRHGQSISNMSYYPRDWIMNYNGSFSAMRGLITYAFFFKYMLDNNLDKADAIPAETIFRSELFGDEGAAPAAVVIKTADEFIAWAADGTRDGELDSDITLPESYVPGELKANLDGRNHKVTYALDIEYTSEEAGENPLLRSVGLFRTLTGSVKNLKVAGSTGAYWSSSLDKDSPYYAWFTRFYYAGVDNASYSRSDGFSIRPVYEE